MKRVLLLGATGYLGSYIAKTLVKRGYQLHVVVRDKKKFEAMGLYADTIIEGSLSDAQTYAKGMRGVDVVISTLGITRQKDGLSYWDVDYGMNRLALNVALKHACKKFIYISVLHGQNLRHLEICDAKEQFVDALQASAIPATVIRPSGFFSDMTEFVDMAKRGRVYLFGDGLTLANPIDGSDLARVCVDAIDLEDKEIEVGGPEVLSHQQMAEIAFESVGKHVKITTIPDGVRKFLLAALPYLLSSSRFGPIAFFLNVMAIEMKAPRYGVKTLKEHFRSIEK